MAKRAKPRNTGKLAPTRPPIAEAIETVMPEGSVSLATLKLSLRALDAPVSIVGTPENIVIAAQAQQKQVFAARDELKRKIAAIEAQQAAQPEKIKKEEKKSK